MRSLVMAAAVSFVLAAVSGPGIIRYLRKLKFGQKILEIGPKWHMNKQYTPTMGGFIFILPVTAAVLIAAGPRLFGEGRWEYAAALLLSLVFGAIGLIDDYTKVKKKENAGLTPRQKLLLQIAAAVLFVTVLRTLGVIGSELIIPFTPWRVELPWLVYLLFATFVIVGTDNAVNLTDGIDGLAAGVTLPVAIFFAAVAWRQGNDAVAIFAAALAGGLAAFLIYNFNPAKVFMGDTGSLFLGGAVSAMAISLELPLILIPVGIVYIVETLSDILQVCYFKATGGKRLFKMAPIHHHFELCGWSERRIVLTFASVTALMCIVCYLGLF